MFLSFFLCQFLLASDPRVISSTTPSATLSKYVALQPPNFYTSMSLLPNVFRCSKKAIGFFKREDLRKAPANFKIFVLQELRQYIEQASNKQFIGYLEDFGALLN